MADTPSPTTFRLSAEDRALLEAVAHASGRSLSAFVRDAALAAARGYLAREGLETVLERDRAYTEKQAAAASRLADDKRALLRDAAGTPDHEPQSRRH